MLISVYFEKQMMTLTIRYNYDTILSTYKSGLRSELSMLNRIILIGRLTRDPEVRYTPQGVPVANFTLAVDRPFTNQSGKKDADFIDCLA